MRLIDADAFAAEMRERQEAAGAWLREAANPGATARADAVLSFLCEVKLTLDKMPTVDAVPVRHGRNLSAAWPTLFNCSECGYYNDDTTPGGTDTFNYCPICGAKINKEENDDT